MEKHTAWLEKVNCTLIILPVLKKSFAPENDVVVSYNQLSKMVLKSDS